MISLILLLFLTAGFFLAARIAITAVNGSVERAIATATVIVLPPSPTPLVSPTVTPTPRKHVVTNEPTATPAQGSSSVIVSSSANASDATSTFSTSVARYWCLADMSALPVGTAFTWEWQQLNGNNVQDVFPAFTITYAATHIEAYANGPYAPGKYRCLVKVNGQIRGSGDFTVK